MSSTGRKTQKNSPKSRRKRKSTEPPVPDDGQDPYARVPQINTLTNEVRYGRAAPIRRNLKKYHKRHPHMRTYVPDPDQLPPVEEGFKNGEGEQTVAVWKTRLGMKITGNSAPYRKNIKRYLATHPDCELYVGQDLDNTLPENFRLDTQTGRRIRLTNGRLALRNRISGKTVTGNCCPTFGNLEEYLIDHPYLEAVPFEAENNRDDNGDLGDLLPSHCCDQDFGQTPLDNLFHSTLTHEDEFPIRRESFDEAHLEDKSVPETK